MATANSKKKSRLFFVVANKYQREIILLAFIPSVLIFLSFIAIVFIGNPIVSNAVLHTSFFNVQNLINHFSVLIIFLICFYFISCMVLTFIISDRMVGAFDRIVRELDEVIAGRSQKLIKSRPEDTLSKDLIKRINVLIESYVKQGNKNN